jgi:uncharacterized protein (TIGR02569 family)
LEGGEGRTYRVGEAVFRRVDDDYLVEALWLADLLNGVHEDGFRVARPRPSRDGAWLVDGWTAGKFLDGHHDYRGHIPAAIDAILAFHTAVQLVPRPDFLELDDGPFARADRCAWGRPPDRIHPDLIEDVLRLYALRRPVKALRDQVIHGDLNPDNILFADGLEPGIIDIAPYWRPPEFALAVFAYWIGPWRDDVGVLGHFADLEEFDQMLVRAALRMLLIMSEFGVVKDFERYRRATDLVQEWLERRH